jgi:hypothetical protein
MLFSKTFRKVAWLVVIALLAQTWHGPMAAAAKAMDGMKGLVICTGAGFKVIAVPEGALPPDVPSEMPSRSDASTDNCLTCLVQIFGPFDNIDRVNAPSQHRYWMYETIVTDYWAAEPLCHRPLSSRAPPLIST